MLLHFLQTESYYPCITKVTPHNILVFTV